MLTKPEAATTPAKSDSKLNSKLTRAKPVTTIPASTEAQAKKASSPPSTDQLLLAKTQPAPAGHQPLQLLSTAAKGGRQEKVSPTKPVTTADVKLGLAGTTPTSPAPMAATPHKEVVEISVEVSASDVKKVLEKKRAEKESKLMTNGEEKLFSNYSIVDQIKKAAAGGSAASLARQKTERASMMDFARSSDALIHTPKVPPTIQGLQPKLSANSTTTAGATSEANMLSAIVESLAQRQQKLQHQAEQQEPLKPKQVTTSSRIASSGSGGMETVTVGGGNNSITTGAKQLSDSTKSLGNLVHPTLATKSLLDKPVPSLAKMQLTSSTPKLPTATTIKTIGKETQGHSGHTSVETGGVKGQQMLNFYKNNFSKNNTANSLSEAAAKSAETLTKNIPAGTTVTVKTVDSKAGGKTMVASGLGSATPIPPVVSGPLTLPPSTSSSKNAAMKSNPTVGMNFPTSKSPLANPFASAVTAASSAQPSTSLINPFVNSTLRDSMTMALAQQAQYLNFNNQGFGAALAAQMEASYMQQAAANIVRAAQAAAQISQTPPPPTTVVTTLAFTKPTTVATSNSVDTTEAARFGLKIPTPPSLQAVQSRQTMQQQISAAAAQPPISTSSLVRQKQQPPTSPAVSSFGTSRLQVKVNSDLPPRELVAGGTDTPPTNCVKSLLSSTSASSGSGKEANGSHLTTSNCKTSGTHSMPAILPFPSVKKVQALPKSVSQSPRPVSVGPFGSDTIPSMLANRQASKSPPGVLPITAKPPTTSTTATNNTVQALTDSNPFKTSATVRHSIEAARCKTNNTPPTTPTTTPLANSQPKAKVNSLKKLASDLNTAQQKTLKGDASILSSLKKSDKLKSSSDLKGFGLDKKAGQLGQIEPAKEVSTS